MQSPSTATRSPSIQRKTLRSPSMRAAPCRPRPWPPTLPARTKTKGYPRKVPAALRHHRNKASALGGGGARHLAQERRPGFLRFAREAGLKRLFQGPHPGVLEGIVMARLDAGLALARAEQLEDWLERLEPVERQHRDLHRRHEFPPLG